MKTDTCAGTRRAVLPREHRCLPTLGVVKPFPPETVSAGRSLDLFSAESWVKHSTLAKEMLLTFIGNLVFAILTLSNWRKR